MVDETTKRPFNFFDYMLRADELTLAETLELFAYMMNNGLECSFGGFTQRNIQDAVDNGDLIISDGNWIANPNTIYYDME